MKKLNKTNEQGRSMVEMLGVLAIIGVLSVGGIAGYTTAMNNHRANEAITHALRLATLASGKRLLSPTATLDQSELSGTNFTFANKDPNGFTLTISDLSPAVIAKINKMKTDLAAATISDDGSSVTFEFKNDLSDGSGSEDDANSGVCPNGNVYLSYKTDPCGTATELNQATCENKVLCCCDSATNKCVAQLRSNDDEESFCPEEVISCTKNSGCPSGWFCNISDYALSGVPKLGHCAELEEGESYTYNGKLFWVSGKSMTWWAAENWCKAQGKKMATFASLGITADYDDGSNGPLHQVFGPLWPWVQDSYDDTTSYFLDEWSVSTNVRGGFGPALCYD